MITNHKKVISYWNFSKFVYVVHTSTTSSKDYLQDRPNMSNYRLSPTGGREKKG